MVRALAVLLAVTAVGCTDGDAPPLLVFDMGPDASVGDLGGVGAPCTTACDCAPGLACRMGSCEATAAMVFCCGTAACAGASLCEFPDGTIAQCDRVDGGGVAPVVDGGPSTTCEMTSCTRGPGGDLFCRLACGNLGATCVGSGGNDHCMP